MSSDGWKILIVDASPEGRAEVRRLLLQGSPRRFRFIEAAAADAGLRLGLVSREERPDCMIVDFHLPDADAFETLARLRAGTKATPFPVVVITDDLDHALAREVLQAGAHDYIGRKWMTPGSLTRAVECAVERFARDEEPRSTLRALEEEQARLRVVLENLPVGVLLTDAAGRASLLNSTLNDIWRGSRPLDDLEKYRSYRAWRGDTNELIEPGDWPVSLALATGAPQAPRELKIERFDGTTGVILASAVPIRDDHGTLVGAASVVQDITDQKAAENILRESEAKFRTVLTYMLEGVNIADRNGALLYTNPAFDRMFGYPETVPPASSRGASTPWELRWGRCSA